MASAPVTPVPPAANARSQPLAEALRGSEALGSLLQRLRASQARLAVVTPLLPPALAGHARAGALEDKAWTLLADHAAAAAKLRQLLPELQAALAAAGWPEPPIRIKVSPPR